MDKIRDVCQANKLEYAAKKRTATFTARQKEDFPQSKSLNRMMEFVVINCGPYLHLTIGISSDLSIETYVEFPALKKDRNFALAHTVCVSENILRFSTHKELGQIELESFELSSSAKLSFEPDLPEFRAC